MFILSINDVLNFTRIDVYIENGKIITKTYNSGNEVKTNKDNLYYINKLYNLLFNIKKVKVSKEGIFEYYKDSKLNLLHRTINGREDFKWFFENNGYEDIVFNQLDDSGVAKKREQNKKIVASISCALLLIISANIPFATKIFEVLEQRKSEYDLYPFQVETVTDIDEFSEYGLLEKESIIEEIINEEKSKTLDSEIKETLKNNQEYGAWLYNEQYLNLILHYLPIDFKEKMLSNLKELKVEANHDECEKRQANGYYSSFYPNTLYYKDDSINKKEVVTHEFIHLTQLGCPFLKETFASLFNNLFYGNNDKSYNSAKNVLMALIYTVGPEPLLRATYGDDYSSLINILNTYLSKEETHKFLKLMISMNSDNVKYLEPGLSNDEFFKLINKLYKNIYGCECPALSTDFIGLPEVLIDEDSKIILKVYTDSDDNIDSKTKYVYFKKISFEEYKKLFSEGKIKILNDVLFDRIYYYPFKNIGPDIIDFDADSQTIKYRTQEGSISLSYEEAYNKGYIEFVNVVEYEEMQKETDDLEFIDTYEEYSAKNGYIIEGKHNKHAYKYISMDLENRFKNQYDNIMSIMHNNSLNGFKKME